MGVQCRNPLCGKAFPIHLDGELMVKPLPQDKESDEWREVTDTMKARLGDITTISATLYGAKTNISKLDGAYLLHGCIHCGRHYAYLFQDFFVTTEKIPHLPDIDS